MTLVMTSAEGIQEGVAQAGRDLVYQFANMEFTSVLMYAVLMVAAFFVCFEGYRIYKLALIVIGFAVGFSRAHLLLDSFGLSDEQMLMAQAVAGIVLAILAGVFVHAGIFIAAYHFAQQNCSAVLAAYLLQHVDLPKLLEPLASRVIGVAIAGLLAWLAVKAERPVIVIVTAVAGGFALVNFFLKMVPVFPVDVSFLSGLPSIVYVMAKVGISAAGVGIQGPIKK